MEWLAHIPQLARVPGLGLGLGLVPLSFLRPWGLRERLRHHSLGLRWQASRSLSASTRQTRRARGCRRQQPSC